MTIQEAFEEFRETKMWITEVEAEVAVGNKRATDLLSKFRSYRGGRKIRIKALLNVITLGTEVDLKNVNWSETPWRERLAYVTQQTFSKTVKKIKAVYIKYAANVVTELLGDKKKGTPAQNCS